MLAVMFGDFSTLQLFGPREWAAMAFVSVVGGAVMVVLWFCALGRTAPTAAAVSVTANPVTASIAGAVLLAEPLGIHLLFGLAAVVGGIWIAASSPAATPGAQPVAVRSASRSPQGRRDSL